MVIEYELLWSFVQRVVFAGCIAVAIAILFKQIKL